MAFHYFFVLLAAIWLTLCVTSYQTRRLETLEAITNHLQERAHAKVSTCGTLAIILLQGARTEACRLILVEIAT